jgi:Leucine-rich repeat (LRR) protein
MTLTIEQEINDFFKKEYLDLNDFFDRMNNDLGVIGGTEKMDELKIVDDKLFPKLKKIVGSNLNIKKVEIKLKSVEEIILPYNSIKKAKIECSSLKVLDLTGNRLNKIKLSDSEGNLFSPNLEKLMVSDNRLEELDKNIRDHHRLRTLFCFQNFLNEINLSEMESLEDLNASFNGCYSDYDGEIVLRNTLEFLNVENCINLKHLDADFNDISTLKVSNLFSLKDISLRANGVNDLE